MDTSGAGFKRKIGFGGHQARFSRFQCPIANLWSMIGRIGVRL